MRLAVCIPEADPSGDGTEHVERAREYAARARDAGVDILVFPETFPGRWRQPIDTTPIRELCEIAAQHDVIVAGGYPEPAPSGGHFNSVSLCDASGEIARYRRVSPVHAPWTYRGGRLWDFEWRRGDRLEAVAVAGTHVGILVCSEVYVPELARILCLQGAELLLYPTGVLRPESELFDTWRTVARARAIENLSFVALCSNATPLTGPGYALVTGPEGVILEAMDAGIHVVDLDLERIRWLRTETDRVMPGGRPWATKPGVLRDWRPTDVLRAHAAELLDG